MKMKRGLIISIITIILLIVIILLFNKIIWKRAIPDEKLLGLRGKMNIKSVFKQGEKIPVRYTADGNDINPPLEVSSIPENTKSLVLIMDDPDAPIGDWVHWIIFNIPVLSSEFKIEEGSVPSGIQGINSWRRNNYGGPNPPSGVHRYFFKFYALDVSDIGLDKDAQKEDVLKAIEGHVLDKAELMGVYGK